MPKYQVTYSRAIGQEATIIIKAKSESDLEEGLCELDLDDMLPWRTMDYEGAEQYGEPKVVDGRKPVTANIQKKFDKLIQEWDKREAADAKRLETGTRRAVGRPRNKRRRV